MIIDIVFLVLMIMAIFKGYSRGLIVAIFSIVASIVGLAAAIKLSTVVAAYLAEHAHLSGKWLPVISFLLVFIGIILLVRVGAAFIEKMVDIAMLGWLNRIGGIFIYALLYSIVFSILLFYAVQISIVGPQTLAESVTWPVIQPLGPKAINALGWLVPFFKDMFTHLQNFFGNMQRQTT